MKGTYLLNKLIKLPISLFLIALTSCNGTKKESLFPVVIEKEIRVDELGWTKPVSHRTRSIFNHVELGQVCASIVQNQVEFYSLDSDSLVRLVPAPFASEADFQIQSDDFNRVVLASNTTIYRLVENQWESIDLRTKIDSVIEIRDFTSLAITRSYDVVFSFAAIKQLDNEQSSYYDDVAIWRASGRLELLNFQNAEHYESHQYLIPKVQIACKGDSIYVSNTLCDELNIYENGEWSKVFINNPYVNFEDLPDETHKSSDNARLAMYVYNNFEQYGPMFMSNNGELIRVVNLRVNESNERKSLIQVIYPDFRTKYYTLPTDKYSFEPAWNCVDDQLIYMKRNDNNETCSYLLHYVSMD